MIRVVLESPFAPPNHPGMTSALRKQYAERNQAYLRALALWALGNGWSPYASHAMLTQWLDDADPEQRDLGITSSFAWTETAERVLVGVDLGVSNGMHRGLEQHEKNRVPVEYIMLGGKWKQWALNWPRSVVGLTVKRTESMATALSWIGQEPPD